MNATPPKDTGSLFTSLRRLFPLGREVVPRLALGLTAAALAGLVSLAIPRTMQALVNGPLAEGGGHSILWIGVLGVLLLGILEAVLLSARRQFVIDPGNRLESKLRVLLYRHLVELPPQFHDDWSGGQLLARSVSDIRRFRRWITFGMIMICVNVITILAGTTLLVLTSPLLGVIFIAGAFPAFAMSLRARRNYRVLSRRSQDQAGDLGTTIEESVHGIRVLKAYGREREALRDFSNQAEDLKETEMRKANSRALVTLLMTVLPETALAFCLVIGVMQVAAGTLSMGAILAFFATAMIVSGPLERLGEQFAMSMEAKTAIDRFLEVLEEPNPLTDPDDPQPVPDGPGAVEFVSATFAFPDTAHGEAPVLESIDLRIQPGETLALVGLTGSGKSTLAQLVPRFYDVTAGQILIDGTDVRALARRDLRRLVSIAFEDPILFSSTVRDNVTMGVPDATEEEIREALDVAQADFVERLPESLDTRIGEEGLSLSGGQRQRLSLARAIIARPRILVLDDPLSALDVRTEAEVTRRLREYLRGTTTIVIAHRPSTVALADRVAVLHEGRIVAIDTHERLLADNALYRYIISNEDSAPRTAWIDEEVAP